MKSVKPIPQERVHNNTAERIVDVPIPQIAEETVDLSDVFAQRKHLQQPESWSRVPRPQQFHSLKTLGLDRQNPDSRGPIRVHGG